MRAFIFSLLFLHLPLLAPTPSHAQEKSQFSFIDLLPEKHLPRRKVGINAFANNREFGSVRIQYNEVRRTLGLRHVRVLFAWNDQIQPTPDAEIFWGFYDDIARSIPRGTKALVVLTGIPSWMENSANWDGGDPRATFVRRWVRPVLNRYRRNRRLKAFQIWNEPNDENLPENVILELTTPSNYLNLLAKAYPVVKRAGRRKKVVMAATTAINQNYPDTLNYNKELLSRGIEAVTDSYAVHYYGSGIETLLLPNGVGDFLHTVDQPIWLTESGEDDMDDQQDYARRLWPYLFKEFPRIKRAYLYQFTEATRSKNTFAIKNLSRTSSLYDYFQSRVRRRRR